MKGWKLGLAVVAGIFVVAIGVLAYLVNSALSGGAKGQITAAATKALGTKVDFESYGLDFASLLRLKPAANIKRLVIANPPGFSNRNLLEAAEVSAQLDLSAAMSKKIEVTTLEIVAPKVLVETGADEKSNLAALLANLQKPKAQTAAATSDPSSATEVSIARIALAHGEVALASAAKPDPKIFLRDLNLSLDNLAPAKSCDLTLATQLFEAGSSSFKLAGKAGPFNAKGLPLDGKAQVSLALSEIPEAIRKERLGDLMADPGKDARIDLDLALGGDLESALQGTGQLKVAKLLIGPGQQGRLALSGTAPLAIRVIEPLSGGEAELRSDKATFALGSGQWNGNLLMQRKGSILNGGINGGIQNVDVNQMMTSFAAAPNKVYGTLAIPQFDLKFAGSSPEELQRSLAGQGRLTIANGRFQGLSVLSAVEAALGGKSSSDGTFAQFSTNFGIQKQIISLTGISATGPGVQVGGQGTVSFNKALGFTLQSRLTGATADRLRGLTAGVLSGDLVVPVQIAGTLDNPQVRPDTKGLMKSAASSAVQGILGGFLGRKKK